LIYIINILSLQIATIYSEDDKVQVKIFDLKPNTKYEIKVSCKTVRKGIWSIPVSTTVLTKKSSKYQYMCFWSIVEVDYDNLQEMLY